MNNKLGIAGCAAAMLLAGCWTFNETVYPETQIAAAKENAGTVRIAGFEAVMTEYEAVHGFQTVYVPGYYGRRHMHPGHFETVPVTTYVQQQRSSSMFLERARDTIERAGYTLSEANSDLVVEVRFGGPHVNGDDEIRKGCWNLFTVFFCDYGVSRWTAALRIRDGKTGKLLFAHDYDQSYEVNVFGLIPLFGIASSHACDRATMQSWCLAALTDRTLADATAFLAGQEQR